MVNTAVYTAVFSQTKGKCWKWRQCWQMKEKQIFELVLIPFLLLSDRRLAEVTSLDCICLHGCSVGFWKRTSSAHTFSQRFVTLVHGWSYLGFSTSDMHTHKNTHTVWRSDRHRCPVFDLGAMLPRKVCLTASLSPLVSRLDHLATHIQLRAQDTCRCCHYSHKQGYSHTRSSVRQ